MDKNTIKANVVDALRNVYDPEMPSVSVLDLGLIYELDVTEEGHVDCKHTLTSMACPFADQISKEQCAIKEWGSPKKELVLTPLVGLVPGY